jgi:hypothetical protein
MYSHTLIVTPIEGFLCGILIHVCALLARSLPGSFQHTPVVFEYLEVRTGPSVYKAFIVFHEVFIFFEYDSFLFLSILNVLVL